MVSIKENIHRPQEDAERIAAGRDETFQRSVAAMKEHSGDIIAKRRFASGRSTSAVVSGSPTERWVLRNGRIIKNRTDLGRSVDAAR